MAHVEQFEIPVDAIARAQAFYKATLGFDYEPWGDDMGMLSQPDSKGINGDLHLRSTTPHPTVVFTVDSIEETVAKVTANGGSQVGEIESMEGMGRWTYFKDSEGNLVGLFDEAAPA